MAGDFSAILEIIADIVIFVIKRTIDLICLCVYLASLCLPWRIIEELNGDSNDDWRCNAFVSLALTIFDCIAIPLGVVSMASPLRWPHIGKAFSDYTSRNPWYISFLYYFFIPYFFLSFLFIN